MDEKFDTRVVVVVVVVAVVVRCQPWFLQLGTELRSRVPFCSIFFFFFASSSSSSSSYCSLGSLILSSLDSPFLNSNEGLRVSKYLKNGYSKVQDTSQRSDVWLSKLWTSTD